MNWDGWFLRVAGGVAASIALLACKPEIGDSCEVSSDCSATGDRLCDTTQPGGYCTQFNCEPGSCPEEAVCIGYSNVVSPVPGCAGQQGGQRLQRTFCLKRCDSDDDCRGGYDCVDMGRQNPWAAIVVERGRPNGKVCAVPFRGNEPDHDAAAGICTGGWSGSDAGPTLDAAPDGDPDAPPPDATNDGAPLGDAGGSD
jgi:hypothetical protein